MFSYILMKRSRQKPCENWMLDTTDWMWSGIMEILCTGPWHSAFQYYTVKISDKVGEVHNMHRCVKSAYKIVVRK